MVSFGEPGARQAGYWSGRRFRGKGVAQRRVAARPGEVGFTVVGRDKVAGDGDEDINEESLRLD